MQGGDGAARTQQGRALTRRAPCSRALPASLERSQSAQPTRLGMARAAVLVVACLVIILSGVASSWDDEPTRIRHLQDAMRLLIDQCEGRKPLTPYGDMKLPCGGRDLMDGALGHLLISGGDDTAGCMAWLRNPASGSPASFGGQPWPAIWYTYGERFNESDRAWLFDRMNETAAGAIVNHTNTSAQAAAGTWHAALPSSLSAPLSPTVSL